MLNSLHIENIAVIKSVDIDFSNGFSALTGETGAGKSIIIDSINLLLGKKAEKELIRKGESCAMVSGLFSDISDTAKNIFSESGVSLDDEGNILVQRSISQDGRSQIKINGRTVSIAVLKSIAPMLVNIHGQSDTHSLTDSANHIAILDMISKNAELLSEYSKVYTEYETARREIKSITAREQEIARYTEILEYQISDIDAMELHDGEEEELIDKKLKIKNSERISKQSGFAYKALKGSEKGSISYLLERSATALSSISDVVAEFADYAEKLRDFRYQIDDIAEEIYATLDEDDEDPTEKLNKIESRLDKISKLKRKYGLTVSDILAFREKAFLELDKLKNSESIIKELEAKEEAAYNSALKIASEIHSRRINGAKLLEKSVCETLEFLDMPKVVFIASVKENCNAGKKILSAVGYNDVEFLISANRGLDPKPLAKIASGGELARIMLAIKSVIADKDGVMTIVFDEIDAGVSGKTARKIGIKMMSLAQTTQIFCVTHSAQIASLADNHYLINKNDVDGFTETSVSLLDYNGRIKELSRILGGINVTDAQREAAVDMLKEKEIYKKA